MSNLKIEKKNPNTPHRSSKERHSAPEHCDRVGARLPGSSARRPPGAQRSRDWERARYRLCLGGLHPLLEPGAPHAYPGHTTHASRAHSNIVPPTRERPLAQVRGLLFYFFFFFLVPPVFAFGRVWNEPGLSFLTSWVFVFSFFVWRVVVFGVRGWCWLRCGCGSFLVNDTVWMIARWLWSSLRLKLILLAMSRCSLLALKLSELWKLSPVFEHAKKRR